MRDAGKKAFYISLDQPMEANYVCFAFRKFPAYAKVQAHAGNDNICGGLKI
jgi:hypothetical protein